MASKEKDPCSGNLKQWLTEWRDFEWDKWKCFIGKTRLAEASWKFLVIVAYRICIDGLKDQENIKLGKDGVQVRLRDVIFVEQSILA